MNSYDTLNSASRVSDVMKERAKQREQMLLASQAAALEEGARQRKIDNAQLDSAENLRKMLKARKRRSSLSGGLSSVASPWQPPYYLEYYK